MHDASTIDTSQIMKIRAMSFGKGNLNGGV